MISENLLATYSLLSFIQDSQQVNKGKSILQLFIPIVQETLNWMLSKKATTRVIMGKNTLEIRDVIKLKHVLNWKYLRLHLILFFHLLIRMEIDLLSILINLLL